MRVLYIEQMDGKHGAPKSLMELIKTLKSKENFSSEVVTSVYNEVTEFCKDSDVKYYVSHHHLSSVHRKNSLNGKLKYIIKYLRYKLLNLYAIKLLEHKIDFNKIDIIHSNVSTVDIGCILAKKYDKKHVLHIREFGMKDFGISPFRKDYIKFWNSTVTKFIAISESIRNYWIDQGILEEKIDVIYNGISLKDIEVKSLADRDGSPLKIVMSGSIMETKGQLQLLTSLSKLPKGVQENVQVDLIGDGDPSYIKILKEIVYENRLENQVRFLGYRYDVRNLLREYDIGITCSKSEAFGRVTVEYMATKLLVIASNTGANPEIIDDGLNGYLYQYGDVEDLAEIIQKIYYNRSEVEKMREEARKKVEHKFTTQINTQNIYDLYKKLMIE